MQTAYQRHLAIQARCFHPTGQWEEFPPEAVEQSIVERFEQIADRYPDRIARKLGATQLTYHCSNGGAAHPISTPSNQYGDDGTTILEILSPTEVRQAASAYQSTTELIDTVDSYSSSYLATTRTENSQ